MEQLKLFQDYYNHAVKPWVVPGYKAVVLPASQRGAWIEWAEDLLKANYLGTCPGFANLYKAWEEDANGEKFMNEWEVLVNQGIETVSRYQDYKAIRDTIKRLALLMQVDETKTTTTTRKTRAKKDRRKRAELSEEDEDADAQKSKKAKRSPDADVKRIEQLEKQLAEAVKERADIKRRERLEQETVQETIDAALDKARDLRTEVDQLKAYKKSAETFHYLGGWEANVSRRVWENPQLEIHDSHNTIVMLGNIASQSQHGERKAQEKLAKLELQIKAFEVLKNQLTCLICRVKPRDTLLLPCLHFCECATCYDIQYANRLEIAGAADSDVSNRNADKCPVCRTKIDGSLKVKL